MTYRLIVILMTCAVSAASAEDYPRGPLSRDVVPQRYQLTLEIDPRETAFSGSTAIHVKIAKPTRQVWIHGLGLRVSTATLQTGGRTVPLAYTEIDTVSGVARLDATETVAEGPATLRIAYSADYGKGMTGIGRVVVGEDAYAFTQMQPIDARRAFPGFDDPQFKTPFELTIIAPESDKVVANAPLQSAQPTGNGFVRHEFAPTLPLPTYLVALAVGPLDIVEGRPIPARGVARAPIPQRGVATRGQGPKLAKVLAHTPEIMLALEDYFGMPYPYPKLDQIASPAMRGAMENAGAIVYGEERLLLADDAPPAQLQDFYELAAHEMSHNWVGNLVTPPWWNDLWLNESFATWMGIRIANQLRPDLTPGTTITNGALTAMVTDSRSVGRPIRQPIDANTQIASAFDAISYEKGGGVLSMIESYVGAEVFRRGVRLHLERHPHGTATADEFFAAMAAAAGDPNVMEAFRSFVEQPGLPLVTVRPRSAEDLAITQSRYAPVGSTIAQGQRWTIPLCVNFYGERGTQKRCELMRKEEIRMPIPQDIGTIEAIMPNADGAGYYRFALDARDSAALLRRATTLPDREALVLADSIKSGFAAGRVTLATLLDAMAALAAHPNREASTSLGLEVDVIMARLLDEPQRPVVRRRMGEVYGPRLAAVGAPFDAKSSAADPADVRLLRRTLLYLVGIAARDPGLRARMAEAAVRSLKEPGWLDANIRDYVWAVGVQEQAPGVVDALVTVLRGEDALARSHAAVALGLADDSAVAARMRQIVLDERVPEPQARLIIWSQFQQSDMRRPVWEWIQQNFGALTGRLSQRGRVRVMEYPAPFCDADSQAEVRAFGERKARDTGIGELEVARAVESIGLCMALKDAYASEFKALVP